MDLYQFKLPHTPPDRLIEAIKGYLGCHPYMRVGQLLENVRTRYFPGHKDLFYLDNAEIAKAIEDYRRG